MRSNIPTERASSQAQAQAHGDANGGANAGRPPRSAEGRIGQPIDGLLPQRAPERGTGDAAARSPSPPTGHQAEHNRAALPAMMQQLRHPANAAPAQPGGVFTTSTYGAQEATAPGPQSQEEYRADWNAWAEAGGASGGNRTLAIDRMIAWMNEDDTTRSLDLGELALTSLPPRLPSSLTALGVRSNRLTNLPDNLPSSLTVLDAWSNRLTSLPDNLPSSLTRLDVSRNLLTSLPDNLPSSLTVLQAPNNRLTSLPDTLPISLTVLEAGINALTSLPDNLPSSITVLEAGFNRLTSLPDNLPSSLTRLGVHSNLLASLPDNLPSSLTELSAGWSRLTSLPDNLPSSLAVLEANGNRLTSLPDNLPSSLTVLNAGYNRLTSLPDNLPSSLTRLEVPRNSLTSLPDNLPSSLTRLNVVSNQLTSLPENITTQLSSDCEVALENNRFPHRVLDALSLVVNAPVYRGPRFTFSMAASTTAGRIRSLGDAVANWFEGGQREAVRQTWNIMPDEQGREAFSGFLDRLGNTVNASLPQFKEATAEWLSLLADNAPLRRATFLISQGATESCEDRVSLTFNEMKKARVAHDVENGVYDQRLPELIGVARGMFRLDKLEEIAREKASSLRFVDEIEVYLAYQVKLREPLNLPLDTADMRFFICASVTEADLNSALASVNAAETGEFDNYLSTAWHPWQSVVKRLAPELHGDAQERLLEAMGPQFEERLNLRLREQGLENDSDARRTLGPSVVAEIDREIKGELTRDFLRARNLEGLLPGDVPAPAEQMN